MIIVTGANGHLGRGVVEALLGRVPASDIVATVRNAEKASELSAQGVTVRAADFSDPTSLDTAFAGATQVLVVSVDQIGDAARQLHRNAVEAAARAGARVLYTSHMGTHAGSVFNDHFATEAVMRETGAPFTALRHGFYAESALHLIGRGLELGEIRAPEDGPVSWTARADLAEADAAILASDGMFEGLSPPLTASEAVTMTDIAAIASELTGREIKRTVISDDEFVAEMVSHGAPAHMAGFILQMYTDARRGDFAAVDPTLERLLGRKPRPMRDFLAGILQAT